MEQAGAAGPARTTGVVGLGTTGRSIAERLARAGPVRVHDAAPERRGSAAAAGLVVVESLEELARTCNTIVLALPSADLVEEALAVLAPAAPGLVLLDTELLDPEDSRRMSAMALELGSLYLDTPVRGAPEAAGRWMVEMGGPASAYGLVAGVLAPVAAEVVHVGPVGAAAERAHRGM